MANGVQLATAYVSLNVNTNELGKQIRATFRSMEGQGQAAGRAVGNNLANSLRGSFGSRLSGMSLFAPLQTSGVRWAARAGTTIATTLKNAISGVMKTAGVGLGIGAGLGAADVIGSGLNRLKVLQAAQVQLRVMKKSAEEIRQITDDVLTVVNGTPIALDDAMQAVPQALGAGVKQGQELTRYITAIGDAAASTGGRAGFGQISLIFSQILGKGKLMSEEVLQLEENGVRIRNALMNTLGITGEELNKRLQDGKIGMQEVQAAVQSTFGGLSKQMGDTFEGAVGNLRAATARLGANILGVIFGDPENPDDPLSGATDGVTKLTEKLNDAGEWVKDNREEIRGFFTGARDAAVGLGSAIASVVDWLKKVWQGAQNLGTQIGSAFDRGTAAVGRLWTKVTDTFDRIKTKLSSIVDDVKGKFEDIFGENGWFARQFKRLGDLVDKVRDVLGIGPATANAAAPGGSSGGTTPFNPGPMAPGVASGQQPLGGSTMGLQSVPQFGFDANGNPLISASGSTQFNPGPKAATAAPTIMDAGTPYGLPMGTNTGGYGNPLAEKVFPEWVHQLGAKFGVKPSTYPGHQENSGMNQGIDWVGTADQMHAFAEFLVGANIPGLEQVIWQHPESKKAVGLTPDGEVVRTTDGYYRNDWGGHQDHVHTRFSKNLLLEGFARGGGVWGAGTATSDSIPAMLSNGEHVLTAKDVQAMGGQDAVYAFRAALAKGMIPGLQDGGQVDPDVLLQRQNQLQDQAKATEIAQAQLQETLANPDATDLDKLQAEIGFTQQNRAYQQSVADYPIIASGGTPPDRSTENQILDATDDLRLSQAQLAALPDDAPESQRIAAQAAVDRASRSRQQGIDALNSGNASPDYLGEFFRSAGFTPTAAGNTGVAGTSSLSALFTSANEVVSGLIDTGASLAQMAVSAAASAGTFGAGAAAGPAAGYGIQVGAQVAKRLSAYGFQLGAIGADSLVAQLFPLGAPRWLGYDYTAFAPQLGIQQAALTTLEKMGGDAINRAVNPDGNQFQVPAAPAAPGAQPVATPETPAGPQGPVPAPPSPPIIQPGDPNFYNAPMTMWPFNPNGAGGGGGGGSWAQGGAVKVYDEGGVLKPGDLALNASTRPEKILTQKQWDSLAKLSPAGSSPMVKIDAIYGLSPEDVATQIESKQKLAMMRYAGRP